MGLDDTVKEDHYGILITENKDVLRRGKWRAKTYHQNIMLWALSAQPKKPASLVNEDMTIGRGWAEK